MKPYTAFTTALITLALLALAGCGGIGPQERQAPTQKGQPVSYDADMSKPEGPIHQAFNAALDRNEELFKQSFAPDVDPLYTSSEFFRKFRKKMLTNRIAPVPESTQMIGETEAIVKMRNERGREIPVRVKLVDGSWKITGFDFGPKALDKIEEAHEKANS